jgi:type IV pilus assembly protein PilB
MRILDGRNARQGFSRLGMKDAEHFYTERLLLDHPSGLIVVAGPGGSGITTTAYNMLDRINEIAQNTVSLEAFPEYHLDGMYQSYYTGRLRSSFSETLLLLPLMDVDTVFLGDINTPEARSGAVEAALSGKRVIATMAADDAVMALWRLSQREVFDDSRGNAQRVRVQPLSYSYPERPGLPLQQTLLGVVAQRLVRCICSNCKEHYAASADELIKFGFESQSLNEEMTLFRGIGCDVCRGSGYRGRLGIYEVITMNDEIAELVVRRAPLSNIRDAARANGMKEMKEQGLALILSGQTTPDEVLRVLGHPRNINA